MNERLTAFTGQPLPHFFKYAKDKSDSQVVDVNGSFVNRLEKIIPNPRINMRRLGLGEIDHELLMGDPGIEFDVEFTPNGRVSEDGTDPLIVAYCKFDKRYYMSIDAAMASGAADKGERYMRSRIKNGRIADEIRDALSGFGHDEREIVDILVKFLYGIRKSSNKTALWLCYGDVIYENLSAKLKPRTKAVRCVDCGEWFDVSVYDSATERCDECQCEHKRKLRREQNRRAYLRKKAEKENSVATL